jgi:hypothetical protein
MKHITIFKTDLSKPTGKFLMWSSDPSFRRIYWHGFKGVNTLRYHFMFVCFGFVAAGSVAL